MLHLKIKNINSNRIKLVHDYKILNKSNGKNVVNFSIIWSSTSIIAYYKVKQFQLIISEQKLNSIKLILFKIFYPKFNLTES